MDTTKAQQIALDDALVAPANRLKIGKCNQRLSFTLKSNEPTIQVILDALKLTPFYKAFEITTNAPEIYMQECLSGKTNGLDSLRLSRAQIIWGMYHKKNIDYVYQLWEDLVYQVENKNSKKKNDICYPRFTKVIIDYFMTKDQSISRRNKMFWHTTRDDPMFYTIRDISRHQGTQIYGAILPDELNNQELLDSKAYKEYYAVAFGVEPPKAKTKYKKKVDEPVTPSKSKTAPASKGSRLKSPAKVAKTDKKKQRAMMPKTKGLAVLSKVALTKAEQIKLATKRSKKDFHISYASGSGDGVDIQLKVPDEQQQKVTGIIEGVGVRLEVKNTESDLLGDNLTHPNLSIYKEDDQEEEEKEDDKEVSSDQRVSTIPDYELTYEEENKEGDDKDKEGEQEQDDEGDLYGDMNISLERSDAEMTDAQANKDIEDSHVTLIAEPPVSHTLVNVPAFVAAETPSFDTTIPQPPIPIIQPLQQTPDSITTTTILTMTVPNIPNFASLFQFEQRVFAEVVSLILGIVDNYLASKMKDAVNVAVQLQTNKLREEAQAENHEFFNQVYSTMKAIIKERVQAQVSKIMPKIEKYVTESLGAEVLVRSTNQPQTSYAVAASLLEFELKKNLIDKIEENKSINRLDI
ncbi:hypothetical protein Tco_1137145 [Tanacetum coccineum]